MKSVLFLCTGNSARSQMAEALLRKYGDQYFDPIVSAGTHPAGLNPLAVEAMKRINIDISGAESKSVDRFREQHFDYVITVCDRANEECPIFPGDVERIHWGFQDPAAAEGTEEEKLVVFERVRDEILQRLRPFIALQEHRP